ncbi:MAG: extracellular solute-binding protein [Chloroflexi bacterium]|nr:extracellular solute-binding protein [Chloroflexota bacterium]
MKNKVLTTLVAVVVLLAAIAATALAACTGPAAPPGPAPAAPAAPAAKGEAGWQQAWEKTIADAKKEGKLTGYGLWGLEQRTPIIQAFTAKYGIEVDFVGVQRGAEMVTKLRTERAAGLNLADFFGIGGNTGIVLLKPEGLQAPAEALLILPEVKDPKNWTGGNFPWIEKDKQAIAFIANVDPGFLINTDLVKKGEITSYKDLLKPQYKGKMTLNDPTMGGASSVMFAFLKKIWSQDEAKDYLRRLIKEQNVEIQRDYRLHVEGVAKAKFAVGIGPHPNTVVDFMRAGAPVDIAVPQEGSIVTYGTGAISTAVNPPHPAATKLFLNWLLTKEGQDIAAKSYGQPSIRVDASTEGVFPIFQTSSQAKLYFESEEDTLYRANVLMGELKQVIDTTK